MREETCKESIGKHREPEENQNKRKKGIQLKVIIPVQNIDKKEMENDQTRAVEIEEVGKVTTTVQADI